MSKRTTPLVDYKRLELVYYLGWEPCGWFPPENQTPPERNWPPLPTIVFPLKCAAAEGFMVSTNAKAPLHQTHYSLCSV
jgi:hypothetical protein